MMKIVLAVVAAATRMQSPRHWKKPLTSRWCLAVSILVPVKLLSLKNAFFGVRNLLTTSEQACILKCSRPPVSSAWEGTGLECLASQRSLDHWAVGQQWLTCDLKIDQVWLLSWNCAGLDMESYVQVRHHGCDSLVDTMFPHLVSFWEGHVYPWDHHLAHFLLSTLILVNVLWRNTVDFKDVCAGTECTTQPGW